MKINLLLWVVTISFFLFSCSSEETKIRVILDTDANNELDDQHAIAYMLFSGDKFDVEGITVNKTLFGGNIDQHYAEASRVVKLCSLYHSIKIFKGAELSFDEIKDSVHNEVFDGSEAVNFIIETALDTADNRLVLLPIGKLTNIALALHKNPSIADKVRIVWLGSNYPEPGEYNQENDTSALSYVLDTDVDFEIVTVRYGKPSGTDAVRASLSEITEKMPGKGPQLKEAVQGRHGGQFTNFGDYSISLFSNIELDGDPPSRALFDMAAVAVVKNPSWAESVTIPAPTLKGREWRDRPGNKHTIAIYENFNRVQIMNDFFNTMKNYELVNSK